MAEKVDKVENQDTQKKPENQNLEQTFTINSSFKSFRKEGSDKKKTIILAALGIVIAGVIVSVAVYFLTREKDITLLKPLSGDGAQQTKVINPITGEVLTGELIRPLAIMVNNHVDARPQSGLIYADLTYEIVAEGGITRFVPFYITHTPEKIGPVRSTREYYLVLVKEIGDAMLMHIGWSPQALVAIETWPVRSLGRGGATFWRDNPRGVATEHTAYVNGVELRKRGLELGWEGTRDFDVWKFKDGDKYADAPSATNITIDFWHKGDYSAIWTYDTNTNSYLRFTGYDVNGDPIPHKDQETDEQIKVKNVIVQFADESNIIGDDKNRLEYELVSSGDGLVFLDGKVVEVTWSKEERDTRTKFYDINGKDMEFNPGIFWISIVPSRNVDQVVYSASE